MEIKEFLLPTDTLVKVRGTDKTRLLQELAARAAATLNLDANLICTALLKREDLGSTGTGGGIAVPHARISDLKKPFGILVRLKHAIDFDAIDGMPVDIIFLLLLPAQSGDPLNALASVARRLRNPESVRRLRSAATDEELYRAIQLGPEKSAAENKNP
jgi:PTS system nitrogen regulatory IIA component